MSTLLDDIRRELADLSPEFIAECEPEDESGPSENVIGIADDDLKRLYTLWQKRDKLWRDILDSDKEDVAFCVALNSDLLQNIFWLSVRKHFNLRRSDAVQIRKGWKIVSSYQPNSLFLSQADVDALVAAVEK